MQIEDAFYMFDGFRYKTSCNVNVYCIYIVKVNIKLERSQLNREYFKPLAGKILGKEWKWRWLMIGQSFMKLQCDWLKGVTWPRVALLPKTNGSSRQVVSHGSGVSRQVSQYHFRPYLSVSWRDTCISCCYRGSACDAWACLSGWMPLDTGYIQMVSRRCEPPRAFASSAQWQNVSDRSCIGIPLEDRYARTLTVTLTAHTMLLV